MSECPAAVETKVCSRCGEEKPVSEFYRNLSCKDFLTGQCKPCKLETNRLWRSNNRGRVLASKKNYAAHNREKHREWYRARMDIPENRDRYRETFYRHKLAKRYGLSVDQYDAMVERCQGRCEICGKEMSFDLGVRKNRACVDHDHATGKTRGILCVACNRSLGTFGDSVAGLRRALDYLQRADASVRLGSEEVHGCGPSAV